jgi:chemotaxis protein methyltransferase CheR
MLPPADVPITDAEFASLRDLVYAQTGISLRDPKRALLKSRLMKRLRHYRYEHFAQYYDHLKNHDPAGCELQAMINAVTTNKTSFFREEHHFAFLAERILAPANRLALQARQPSLRIWSAGCSSGEEPYSIAITLATNLDRLAAWDVKILASDIDTEMLEKARTGIYSKEAVSALPASAVKRHFLRGTGQYANCVRVKPLLRNLVTFARINLVEPWPFRAKFDAIFCRNVIIYFDHDSQQQVLERFAQCLKPEGLFFAGHSESLFWLDDLFEPVGHTAYRARPAKSPRNTDRVRPL